MIEQILVFNYIPDVSQETLTILFLLGAMPGTLFLANKCDVLQKFKNKYNEVDKNNVLTGTLLFFLLPFVLIFIYTLDIELNKTLTLILTPLLTGGGILIGNTLIDNNKKRVEIQNLKKLLSLVLGYQKDKLIMLYHANDVMIFDTDCLRFISESCDLRISSSIQERIKHNQKIANSYIEFIKYIKNHPNYKTILTRQIILPVNNIRVLGKYINTLEQFMIFYETNNKVFNPEDLNKIVKYLNEEIPELIKLQKECIQELELGVFGIEITEKIIPKDPCTINFTVDCRR